MMWKCARKNVLHQVLQQHKTQCASGMLLHHKLMQTTAKSSPTVQVPATADVVIIGGGSAGCHTLYHLAKRGVKAVLLERAKLTAGTTWHTAGLVWRLRPNVCHIWRCTLLLSTLKFYDFFKGCRHTIAG